MLHLGSAYAHSEGCQRAVGCSMGIATHDGHPGQAYTLLRANDMYYALTFIREFNIGNAPFPDVSLQGIQLLL